MTAIWIVPIEPIERRYTKQWYYDIPVMLAEAAAQQNKEGWKIRTIDGKEIEDKTTNGAFLDFGATNFYKASQVAAISHLFQNGQIHSGDKFLVTDAWNFAVTAIKYMSELLDITVEIHGIWHAGAYDPTDILGMKMSKPWPYEQERAWFHACDYNYYGTEFHRKMFLRNLNIPEEYHNKAIRSGQPSITFARNCYEQGFNYPERENAVLFPHRLNADKQPEIFRDIIKQPETEKWFYNITMEKEMNKDQFYSTLAQSKIVFSCSLHENLGISQMEGVLCGCIPVMPNRASYTEIYNPMFLYPSEWTESFEAYENHKKDLIGFIENLLKNYQEIHDNELKEQAEVILKDYMSPKIMIDNILKEKD